MRRTLLIAILVVAAFSSGRADAHPPWGIAVDDRGRVYFADIDHGNHIWRIDAPGKLTSVVAGRHSHDLHLGRDGTLFVSHIEYIPRGERFESRLLKIGPDGATAEVIPPTTDRKRFWGNAFTLDGDGNVYFGYTNNPRAGEAEDESLLLKRSPDGRVTVLAGSKAGHRDGKGKEARFRAINALAWGPDGVLYVADEAAIRKVARDGTVTTLARDLVAKGPDCAGRGCEPSVRPGGRRRRDRVCRRLRRPPDREGRPGRPVLDGIRVGGRLGTDRGRGVRGRPLHPRSRVRPPGAADGAARAEGLAGRQVGGAGDSRRLEGTERGRNG